MYLPKPLKNKLFSQSQLLVSSLFLLFFLSSPSFAESSAEPELSASELEAELEQLEIDKIESELNSISDSVDLLSTIETDTDIGTLMTETQSTDAKVIVKKKIRPQQCFVSALKNKPLQYSVCGDGRTILDKNTGLMWMRCSLGKRWDKVQQRCEGTASIHNWKQGLQQVVKENKQSLLAHSDWRLPNIKELSSLVETACAYPAIDAYTFPEAYNEEKSKHEYWTSSVFEQYPQRAWTINFDLGHDKASDKRQYKQLRLVRLGNDGSYNLDTNKRSELLNACVTYPAIKFSNVINVPTKSMINSAELEVVFQGVESLPISIDNGEYQVNGNNIWTKATSRVMTNDRVKVRHLSSAKFISDQVTTLTVGQQKAQFRSTTLKATAKAFNDYLSDGKLGFDNSKPLDDQLYDVEVNFDYKSALLTDKAKTEIGDYFETRRDKFVDIKVIQLRGHTDSIASQEYNQTLSVRRALSVFEFLHLVPGLESVKIDYLGKGKLEPIASNDTPEGRARNRRVSILVTFQEELKDKK